MRPAAWVVRQAQRGTVTIQRFRRAAQLQQLVTLGDQGRGRIRPGLPCQIIGAQKLFFLPGPVQQFVEQQMAFKVQGIARQHAAIDAGGALGLAHIF